jgi:nitrous oxidase accessory protein
MKLKSYIAFFAVLLSFAGHAGTIRVGKGQPLPSVSKAIATAKPGDTILISPGYYREKNIVINKQLTLIGDHYPVFDGEGKYENFSVKANGVTIRGLRVIHSGVSSLVDVAAIKIYEGRDVLVADNILEDNFFGIYLEAATRCKVENNVMKASEPTEQRSANGIHCWKCDSLLIIGNKVSGHRDGIYFEFTTNSLIWRNVSKHNLRYGLHFMFSHNDAYISNIFEDNSAGVSVMFTHGVKMFNNLFQNNWGDGAYGLLLKEINDSYVSGNLFISNTSGIFMEGCNRIEIERNRFRSNGWAMKIQASCMDVHVTHNDFVSNTFDVGTNGTLVLNSFNNNYWDKYEGYDLNKDNIGDIPFHPVSLFSVIVSQNPSAMMLFRSFMTSLMDKTERIIPSLTPENLKDDHPSMKPLNL